MCVCVFSLRDRERACACSQQCAVRFGVRQVVGGGGGGGGEFQNARTYTVKILIHTMTSIVCGMLGEISVTIARVNAEL